MIICNINSVSSVMDGFRTLQRSHVALDQNHQRIYGNEWFEILKITSDLPLIPGMG